MMAASTTEPDDGERSDIDLIWKQVQERVVKLAGGDPGKVQKHLGIDGVLAFIDQAQAAQTKKSEKYSWFKVAVGRTLQCIQTVGGIVASAASPVGDTHILVAIMLMYVGFWPSGDVLQCTDLCHPSLAGI